MFYSYLLLRFFLHNCAVLRFLGNRRLLRYCGTVVLIGDRNYLWIGT